LQQKLLGPIGVCPGWQLEFEQAPLAAICVTLQHVPLIWTLGLEQPPHSPVPARGS
jgi:hypothetical protein